jgi:hypothetical protein
VPHDRDQNLVREVNPIPPLMVIARPGGDEMVSA